MAENTQNSVVIRTNPYVELRMDNVSEWPDDGEISRADLLKIGFGEHQVNKWEERGIAVNVFPEKQRKFRSYIILPIKDFLLNRVHSGPFSRTPKNNLVG